MRAVCVFIAIAALVSAAPMYSIRAVGPANSTATAVSRDGTVSGYSVARDGTESAFVFDGTRTKVLSGRARALDAATDGQAIGVQNTSDGVRGTVWNGAVSRLLDLGES